MGNQLLVFYQNRVKKNWKLAFMSAVVMGFLVHAYRFTNYFPNHDGLHNFWSTQDMLSWGRWLLSIACAPSSYFDVPWIIGVFCVGYLALTAVFITEIFHMENPVLIVLSSGLLVSFPAVTDTMFFEFTADGYMLAMMLGALAVCLSRLEVGFSWKWGTLSAACICAACAIYQAYVAFAFVLAVCYFLCELLENRHSIRECWKWVGYQTMIFVAGLASYYGIWQLIMRIRGVAPVAYEGIGTVGAMSGSLLWNAVKRCISSFIWFFLERNPVVYGVSVYSALGILFGISFVTVVILAGVRSGISRRLPQCILFVLCLISLPFGCYLCFFTSPDVGYYTRMVQAIAVLYILLGVLCDRWASWKVQNGILILLIAVVLNNSVTANICYAYLNRCHEKTLATATELSTRIHMEDDGTVENIAFLGEIGGLWSFTEEEAMDPSKFGALGHLKAVNYSLLSDRAIIALVLNQYLDFTLEYYRTHDVELPVYPLSASAPVTEDFVLRFPIADEETMAALVGNPEVQEMGLWPGRDSVKRIGRTIVIRLSSN